MKIRISLILVFAVLIVIFTLQNTEVVSIKLWFWQVQTSRALIIIASVAIGSFFGMLLPPLRRNNDKVEHNTFEKTGSEKTSDKD